MAMSRGLRKTSSIACFSRCRTRSGVPILGRLDAGPWLVSELAAPFSISLQAVSRHIQVLARAGLVRQQRSGRISRCSLETGPIFAAAIWINRYSKYWQGQFDLLAMTLEDLGRAPAAIEPKTGQEAKS